MERRSTRQILRDLRVGGRRSESVPRFIFASCLEGEPPFEDLEGEPPFEDLDGEPPFDEPRDELLILTNKTSFPIKLNLKKRKYSLMPASKSTDVEVSRKTKQVKSVCCRTHATVNICSGSLTGFQFDLLLSRTCLLLDQGLAVFGLGPVSWSFFYLTMAVSASDLVVSAAGVPGIITREMVKPGAVLVDVGLTRVCHLGKNLVVGDVHREARQVRIECFVPRV